MRAAAVVVALGIVVLAVLLTACGAAPAEPVAPHAEVDAAVPLDRDGDRIVDVDDVCPCDREDVDGWQDVDGCPDPDDDGDRIVDACDVCPREPETYDGRCDEDGCPERSAICVREPRIQISQAVAFARGRSAIPAGARPMLDELAHVMAELPQLELVAVVGESARGEPHREALARARADAVVAALVSRGVDPARLTAVADGAPPEEPSDAAGLHRRVRFEVQRASEGFGAGGDCLGHAEPCEVPACEPPPPAPPAC